MTEKKAADYTNSAENLCNPSEVVALLDALHLQQGVMADIEAQIKEKCADEVEAASRQGGIIAELQNRIKEAIDTYGSYQDIEAGVYAVKYRRITKVYDAEKFTEFFPKYVSVVLTTVNVAALEGLIKGGLIEEKELRNSGVLTDDTKYAFVIR